MKAIKILAALLVVLCLVGCASTKTEANTEAKTETNTEAYSVEEAYSLVGYDYRFILEGNSVTFKYVDAVGDEEIKVIASTLMGILPEAESYSNPKAGEIVILTKNNLTPAEFGLFVEEAELLIYDTIY